MDITRRLTQDEKDNMWGVWMRLVARHAVSTTCEINPEILRDLYVASMEPHERTAWEGMRALWSIRDEDADEMPFRQQDYAGVPVELAGGAVILLQVSADVFEEHRWPVWKGPKPQVPVRAASVLDGRYGEFVSWANLAIEVACRSLSTTHVLEDVHNMANTVGQLHRMVPDLVRYTYPSTQKALQQQRRRSPLPDEWMNVDRRKLQAALDHLALCYLLPQGHMDDYRKVVSASTWAFDRMTARQLPSYYATPDSDAQYTLSPYSMECPFQ